MNIIDEMKRNHPHKELDITKCYICGNEVYPGYVMCKACIADVLIFSPQFADVILGTDFVDNFKIDEWEDVICEKLKNIITKDHLTK